MPRISPHDIYEHSVMTNRSPELLALHYGFKDLEEFIDNVPKGARVIDIGAGFSSLGAKVAGLCPDVSWTNVDQHYDQPEVKEIIENQVTPPNLEFVAGNALDLERQFGAEKFDLALSYWMLPHISVVDRNLGVVAARQMLEITKEGGRLMVGPITGFYGTYNSKKVVDVTKNAELHLDETAADIARTTSVKGLTRYMHWWQNWRDAKRGEIDIINGDVSIIKLRET